MIQKYFVLFIFLISCSPNTDDSIDEVSTEINTTSSSIFESQTTTSVLITTTTTTTSWTQYSGTYTVPDGVTTLRVRITHVSTSEFPGAGNLLDDIKIINNF